MKLHQADEQSGAEPKGAEDNSKIGMGKQIEMAKLKERSSQKAKIIAKFKEVERIEDDRKAREVASRSLTR